MNIEELNKGYRPDEGLVKTLGIEFHSTPEADTIMATMPVDERNVQPYGFLNGGATLALAETVAGFGSILLCPGKACMGMNITASHLHPVKKGDRVTAMAHLIHKGAQTHLWRVDVSDGKGRLASTVNVTNFIKDLTR